jgi:pSer/pThr/pTyr-binding forkhead associated (FHA) protein
MKLELEVSSGPNQGKIIPIRVNPFLIGRGESCHLRPASERVSRQHCRIDFANEAYTISDSQSTDGTYVNGERIEAAVPLRSGDQLRIGSLTFRVKLEATADPVQSALDVSTRSALTRRVVPKVGQDLHSLLGELREALKWTQQIFCPSSEVDRLAQEILEQNSLGIKILAENFRNVLVLDTRQALVEGRFELDKYYQYVAARIYSTLNIAPLCDPHEQDIIQLLRDESHLLILFLFVELVPTEQLRRIRSILQEDHHSLVIYQKNDDSNDPNRISTTGDDERVIERDLSDTKVEIDIKESDLVTTPKNDSETPPKPIPKTNSRDAASETLRKFFGSR